MAKKKVTEEVGAEVDEGTDGALSAAELDKVVGGEGNNNNVSDNMGWMDRRAG